jgi:asparagine synthase (glutamine-hydrolysing)
MCGIAGLLMKTPHASPSPSALEAMRQALSKRGPDGSGTIIHQSVGFVHTRLSIIDTATGGQPMRDEHGRILIFNGEIYNYLEIRNQLQDKYHFKTQSDTEVILALYHVYGNDCVRHLRGMYAFALYDDFNHRLLVARDPFGIKPFYYVDQSQYWAFASEPKALLHSGLASSSLDVNCLRSVIKHGYITGTNTPYSTIQRLKPGQVSIFERGQLSSTYFIPSVTRDAPRISQYDDALQECETTLIDTVSMHCRSDVGYGLFLSGGVDSTAILQTLSLMGKAGKNLHCYTAYFDVADAADERHYAREMAQSVGANFHEVCFTKQDFFTYLPHITAYMDDPVADYAILPTWKLAAVAAESQKVVLCGEGGDELFAGYGRYKNRWWKNILKPSHPLTEESENWSRLQTVQYQDIQEYLPNDLLIKLDTCLMAHGLEGRTPFLDKEVSKFAFNLPDALKMQNGHGKFILKTWLNKYRPEIQPFRKKQGFTVPVGTWMTEDAKDISDLIIHNDFIKELLNKSDIDLIPKLMVTEKGAKQCWPILYLCLWAKARLQSQNSTPSSLLETLAG